MKNKLVSIHSKEEDNNIFDESSGFALSSTFQSLIQMQTQHYQLTSSLSLSTLDAGDSVRVHDGGGVEESKEEEEEQPQDVSNDTDIFSTPSLTRVSPSSSSLVVPQHPHQRIIVPMLHCTDSVTFDKDNDDDNTTVENRYSHNTKHQRQ